MEYEYVNKSEYRPMREELEQIINRVHKYMRKYHDTTFQHRLIGSGKRHLITRIKGGNTGYDFDYNLIVEAPIGFKWKEKVLKQHFMEAFAEAIKGTAYSNPKDSTSAITIKVVDQKNSKILRSCDFAIVYYEDNEESNGYYCLKNLKGQNRYVFEYRNLSHNIDGKLEDVLYYSDGWAEIKKEYLKLKCRNKDENKRSYSIYLEAVNNVHNRLPEDD